MIDISVHELNKYYGSNHVLKGISFEIYKGEKVGLLGKNGSGKTTLFKVIAGEEPYESGAVSKASGKKVEVLAQLPDFGQDDTVEDILLSSFKEIHEIYEAMRKIEGNLDDSSLRRYGRLMEEYERLGGYDFEVKVEKICGGMNIGETMRKSPFSLLSGGEKTRVNLARILLRDCDILLLDEPTNHLDLASLEWLEKFLREFSGTVVVISHDRVFLDNVIRRVIEIEEGKGQFYSGNYSWYAEEKQRRFISQSGQYQRQQKEIKRLEDRAKWFVVQNQFTTKHHALLSRIDHMEKIEKPVLPSKKLTETFSDGGYAAKRLVSFESVCKSYGENMLIDNVSLIIGRGDSIALIGANGCGKTTLIKLITGEEPCDSGSVKISDNVKIAYMPQIIRFDDENAVILETLRRATGFPEEKSRSILAGFHFKAPDVMKTVGSLSGGERSRLKLCLLMQDKANLLIFDEPTNHLDIRSREWIEEAISDFDGTILFISHDRYFLNKFASRIWSMKDGVIDDFRGSFNEFSEFEALGG
ncbi:MAG: ATP-binding cassette domain-containing protein [Oscillospiraceae bacterium]|nr:ATP-binding cassette domain-containing protein [Oscillospiraceae bacterium]